MSKELAEKIGRLAEELSFALDEYDDQKWIIEVRAAYAGRPIFSLSPAELSPQLRLEQFSVKLEHILGRIRPGIWCRTLGLENGYLLIARDDDDDEALRTWIAARPVSVLAT